MGGTFDKLKDFTTGSGDQVAGTGQSVGELKDIGYSNGDIANLGGGQMTTGQKIAKGITGVAGAGLRGMQQPQQQRPQGGAAPIQVAQAPDVSGYYPVRPITPQNPNDPYSAFYRR